MHVAPHLPNRDENIKSSNLHNIITSVVLSLAAGMVGGLVIFAWIIPGAYIEGGILVSRGQNGSNSNLYTEPDVVVMRKIKNISVDVFLKDKIFENGYYRESARVGTGVMLTSNGWGVLYARELAELATTPALRVRDVQGIWYTPLSVVVDKKYGLVYFKLTGNEFYVTSFPDWRTMNPGLGIWAYTGREWRRQSLGEIKPLSSEEIFLASDERLRFLRSPQGVVEQGMIFSDSGDLLGFALPEDNLLDAWIVEYTIPTLLGSGEISKVENGWRGSMVETVEEGKVVKGFLISEVGKMSAGGLKNGDIIRSINDVPVSEFTLYRLVREKPLNATVSRDGELFDILIP